MLKLVITKLVAERAFCPIGTIFTNHLKTRQNYLEYFGSRLKVFRELIWELHGEDNGSKQGSP